MMAGDVLIVVDDQRLRDLQEFDTPASTDEAARAAAAEMAKRTGLPCHILGVVATVEPEVSIKWR
jgi:hypothetical protein